MNKKYWIVLGVGVAIALALASYFLFFRSSKPDIHYHAGFQVYVNNTLQDFSDLKYMQIKPCGGTFHFEDEQIEKAHLHDNIGDVVHVHREGAVWADLFQNIKFEIPTSTEFVGYLNGNRQENILTYPILPYDSVVFFSGPIVSMNQKLQARVTDDHIKEAESRSENCGDQH